MGPIVDLPSVATGRRSPVMTKRRALEELAVVEYFHGLRPASKLPWRPLPLEALAGTWAWREWAWELLAETSSWDCC